MVVVVFRWAEKHKAEGFFFGLVSVMHDDGFL